jgi:hypothetical protein
MKVTINLYFFTENMQNIKPGQISYNGLKRLFEYYEEIEGDEEIEFDPIAIFCEWTEYKTLKEALKESAYTKSQLEDKTTVLYYDGGLLVGEY